MPSLAQELYANSSAAGLPRATRPPLGICPCILAAPPPPPRKRPRDEMRDLDVW